MSTRLEMADRLEAEGLTEAAQRLRDYDAACAWLKTTATYAGREAPDIARALDDWDENGGPSLGWLMERAMVAIWKAAGKP